MFFMPPPAFGRSGAYSVSLWCYVCTCVCHVRNQVQVYRKFRCKFMSAFFLQQVTFIPFGLESWNFVWHLPMTLTYIKSRPRWLSWMRRPTGDQEVAGSTPAEVGNILSWRLIMKYFLRSFSPFRWFKKGSCQFLAKECAQYWLTT